MNDMFLLQTDIYILSAYIPLILNCHQSGGNM